jgi:hypothetical protein
MDFVNEVLPDASEERSGSTATAATGDGDVGELGEEDDVPPLPNYAHYNLADMLRRRWAIHIRTMLSASGVSPPLGSGCSGGTVRWIVPDLEHNKPLLHVFLVVPGS